MGSISTLEGFSVGIGPSSSHTMGPMRAAVRFLSMLKEQELLEDVIRVKVELYGSLALTGKGHATDRAVLLGLEGHIPELVEPEIVLSLVERIEKEKKLWLFGKYPISFSLEKDLCFLKNKRLPFHSNAIRFQAFSDKKLPILSQLYYSIGGGFILSHDEAVHHSSKQEQRDVPYPFTTASELMGFTQKEQKAIWEIVYANEMAIHSEKTLKDGIFYLWDVMQASINRGLVAKGVLPGGLNVKRRAPFLYQELVKKEMSGMKDPLFVMDWVTLFALAVNEENAAGHRVITAPTNGSCGVIPAVLSYAKKFTTAFDEKNLLVFFLTATAILTLYQRGASISAAEMGCQGEIGVSSSMAAAGLTAILGGTNEQIEHAAEIAMEHHLGLTCDPMLGLVQIPCIERNAMGAMKAIQASRLALQENGGHIVSLDAVIAAMKDTGKNMKSKFKETSLGGLALQIAFSETLC